MDLVPAMGARPRCPVKMSASEASAGLRPSHLGVTTGEIGVKNERKAQRQQLEQNCRSQCVCLVVAARGYASLFLFLKSDA